MEGTQITRLESTAGGTIASGAGTGVAPSRPPEVQLTTDALAETCAMLEATVDAIEKRLHPVLRQSPNVERALYPSLVDDASAPHAQRIASLNSHLLALQSRLVEALDRLEV